MNAFSKTILGFWAGFLAFWVGTASPVPVTFQVDLSVQAALGNFDPANDSVIASGTFDNWSTTAFVLTNSDASPTVYSGTFNDSANSPGSGVQYKFIMKTSGGLVWESINNRSFTLSNAHQTLPLVYFNNLTNSGNGVTVTFQINLSPQEALGNFNPAEDTVVASGTFNNWALDFTLAAAATNANVYTGTITDKNDGLGGTMQYKFVILSASKGTTWEGINNRTLALAKTNEVLPVAYFNNLTNAGVKTPITFQVDMSVQTALGNFDPSSDTVIVAGSFDNWSTSALMLTNTDALPTFYSGTYVDSNDATGNRVAYKVVINGSAWETINDRQFTLAKPSTLLAPVFYNDIGDFGALSIGAVSDTQMTLSWTGGPAIRLQTASKLAADAWQDVPNSLGQSTMDVDIGAGPAFFRLTGP